MNELHVKQLNHLGLIVEAVEETTAERREVALGTGTTEEREVSVEEEEEGTEKVASGTGAGKMIDSLAMMTGLYIHKENL